MTAVLALALRLASMDAATLRRLIVDRGIVDRGIVDRGIDDYFDLAERLLGEQSVQDALSRLDRHTLAILATACAAGSQSGPPSLDEIVQRIAALSDEPAPAPELAAERVDRLRTLLLVEEGVDRVSVYPEVAQALSAWPSLGLPDAAQLASRTGPARLEQVLGRDGPAADRLAAERAFRSTAATTELLSELSREPARELARGGLALPDSKRLASALGVELEEIPGFVQIAQKANLIGVDGMQWFVTEQGEHWLRATTARRWSLLAEAWLQILPTDIRSIFAAAHSPATTSALREYLAWLYPAGQGWMQERVTEFDYGADVLGITRDGVISSPGSLLLASRTEASITAMTRLFPEEVERVYLQHDLSIVAPGPLVPTIDARLRTMSDVESRAHASTYRISAGSIRSAIADGETVGSILEFLTGISMTGVPQPLEYLVSETAARHGLLRVGHVHANGGMRSYVASADSSLLGTVAVDRALSSLGFVMIDANHLRCRFQRDVVYWALNDAKYPVAAEDENRDIVAVSRHRAARGRPASPADHDPATALVQRLIQGRFATREQSMRAWLVRQLEASIRTKSTVQVTVELADGTTVDYVLEPASVFGGRLRALDRALDIERTLPVSRIVRLDTPGTSSTSG